MRITKINRGSSREAGGVWAALVCLLVVSVASGQNIGPDTLGGEISLWDNVITTTECKPPDYCGGTSITVQDADMIFWPYDGPEFNIDYKALDGMDCKIECESFTGRDEWCYDLTKQITGPCRDLDEVECKLVCKKAEKPAPKASCDEQIADTVREYVDTDSPVASTQKWQQVQHLIKTCK